MHLMTNTNICDRLDNASFLDADAILFHERNFDRRHLPREEDRRPDQIYVHFTLESPIWSQGGNTNTANIPKPPMCLFKAFPRPFKDYFNISISYRDDADIKSRFYGNFEQTAPVAVVEDLSRIIEDFGSNNLHLAKKKSMVCIFYLLFYQSKQ